ncbi:hypothetical protein Cgig2_030464 [Carnegiea gigantea]|uniref:Uncharacterized protein n=1 Tax=Carnegiea gigantea TaxID=171969 RepID=A0A9Q1KPK2_9CARY|nr:hypothetical protein Cgig2_030464 [Carnegiea gigantea]
MVGIRRTATIEVFGVLLPTPPSMASSLSASAYYLSISQLPTRYMLPVLLRYSTDLHREGVIVRAEDKAQGSSSSSQLQELPPTSGECDPLCSVDEMSSQDLEASFQPKTNLLKALAILAAAFTGAAALIILGPQRTRFDLATVLLFGLEYARIILEESLAFNKRGVGLLMAVSLWVIRSIVVRFLQMI